ncbi:uncharacterized protein MELLADRAFT_34423 [Melampsora larici-populina 98AG31]|uniref:Phosphatidic acid phosphatase type 2/haloperoxidase domain-containing protein n=1 Tax=Melampsora larici-populina (strain 98AG31 / pathotype 3-4-7) TaxID=747676 RepID=F4RDV8_MELLP|nr:uncharacterized protein MELLADRAFT_34423 [Melampsora larici-populina 98AG31]EGG09471.1 hypothetical protein MELLADRAFT_34423 [Melampsora larici-populina 98AG31]
MIQSVRSYLTDTHCNLLFTFLVDFLDWVITFLLWSAAFICDKIDGFRRQFDIHDSSIAHTFTEHERVPVGQLALLSVFLPAISMVILNRLQHHSIRDIHHGLLGLLLGLSLTTVVTQVTKICIGRPRPDLLDRCKPQLPLPMGTIWTNSSICSTHTKSYRLIDGFRSFPSGHSSTAWAGLGFLSLYTSAKLKTFEKPERRVVNPIFSLLPLILASWISISRTMDYRHHWEDVVIGGLLGMLMAWFSYRMYYPSITSQDSHEPFHFRYHHPMLSDYEPVESNIEDEDIP